MKRIIYCFFVAALLNACFVASVSAQTDTAQETKGVNTSQLNQTAQSTSDTAGAASLYPISPERRELLNKYSNFSLGWSVFYNVFDWILLFILVFSGASFALLKLAERISPKRGLQFLIFLLFIILILSLVTLPLDIYRDYFVEHQYGLSSQSFGSWFGDWLKSFSVSYIISAIAFAFLYFMLRKFPRRWWLYFSIGAVPFIIFMMIVAPVVISPLFNKFQPLQNPDLKTEILNLAGKGGISGANVFQVDASKQSNKLNAYVTGLFGTKRIVLYDTIIKAMTPSELLFVVGHEMGHYVMHHVWIMVGMTIVMLFILTWIISWVLPALIRKYRGRLRFDDITSYASLPLILLVVTIIAFFIQPAFNGISRHFEHQADRYGIVITDYNSEAARVAFEKLSSYNLSDPNPNPVVEFWFYNHPALQKRIDFVEHYKGK